mmetsp:Transcript_81651/g.226150  ORF Transcript_81651/g.226150 Transcript_81651/m.226150 type:complete len:189 (+) Transcript_81651:347-913(+)
MACQRPPGVNARNSKKNSVYSMEDIKTAFQRLDQNGDGFLSFSDLRHILLRGNPDFSEKQLRVLCRGLDKDKDGYVEFDEFVDYIYGKPVKRRKDIWQDTFYAYSGSDEHLGADEFLSLCKDSGLCDDQLTEDDAWEIFQVVKDSDDLVGPSEFSKAMTRIARQKRMAKKAVHQAVLSCAGPERNWSY